MTRSKFFYQKLRKGCPISCAKFQHDPPHSSGCIAEKPQGGVAPTPPPLHGRGLRSELYFISSVTPNSAAVTCLDSMTVKSTTAAWGFNPPNRCAVARGPARAPKTTEPLRVNARCSTLPCPVSALVVVRHGSPADRRFKVTRSLAQTLPADMQSKHDNEFNACKQLQLQFLGT